MTVDAPKKVSMDFDAYGSGYDYDTARQEGLGPDESGHWPSRAPSTGMLLKGRKHPTFDKGVDADEDLGYMLSHRDDRYYTEKAPPNYPTYMDRAKGMTGGMEPPMPDSEFGQEGPIVELFIQKILKEHLKKKQLEEHYGMPMEDFEDSGQFTQKFFDPEKTLESGQRWQNMQKKPPGRGDYSPVRPWDMRDF